MTDSSDNIKQLIAETLEIMRLLDHCEEVDDCWLWKGGTNGDGRPQYTPFVPGYGKLLHRAMYKMNGKNLEYRQPLACSCDEKRCINPHHQYATTLKFCVGRAAKRGAYSMPAKCAKIAQTLRNTRSKLTIEQAREIRMSTEPTKVLYPRYGVDASVINGIRSGKRWKEYANTNPFSGLMT